MRFYTWGTEGSPDLLDLGPGVLSITLNLRDALNRIWIHFIEKLKEPEYFLWVDAICGLYREAQTEDLSSGGTKSAVA